MIAIPQSERVCECNIDCVCNPVVATTEQWNLSITDTSVPDIFGHFLLQYRSFPLLEVKIISVTPVGAKVFVLIMEFFSIVSGFVKRGSAIYCNAW